MCQTAQLSSLKDLCVIRTWSRIGRFSLCWISKQIKESRQGSDAIFPYLTFFIWLASAEGTGPPPRRLIYEFEALMHVYVTTLSLTVFSRCWGRFLLLLPPSTLVGMLILLSLPCSWATGICSGCWFAGNKNIISSFVSPLLAPLMFFIGAPYYLTLTVRRWIRSE